LALAAALNPNFRVAPFSAVLVLLISGQLSEGPIESALYRVASFDEISSAVCVTARPVYVAVHTPPYYEG
jgi:hypothetical protein